MTTALLPRGRRGILLPFVLVALFLSASCGGAVASSLETSTPHDVVVVGRPPASGDDRVPEPVPRPTVVPSRDDLLDEERLMPDDVWIDSADPHRLIVRFTAGAAPCTGARLSVDAGPATVDIALYVGTPPERADTVCDSSARLQEVRATLARPVGTRELIWEID